MFTPASLSSLAGGLPLHAETLRESGTALTLRRPKIVVNADDFGRNGLANSRIIHCFQSGLISSATIMTNMPGYEEAIEWRRSQSVRGGRYRIGVHLNLNEGQALSKAFVRITGRKTLFYPGTYLSCEPSYLEAIRHELAAQIERGLKDVEVSHLDSHHHLHTHWPVAKVVVDLARQYNIGNIRMAGNILYPTMPYKVFYRYLINRYFQTRLGAVIYHFASLIDYYSRRPRLMRIADLMVHPELDRDFRLLTSPGYADFLQEHDLVGYT